MAHTVSSIPTHSTEREKNTHTHTETQRRTHTHRQRERERERKTHTHKHTHTDRHREGHTHRERERERERLSATSYPNRNLLWLKCLYDWHANKAHIKLNGEKRDETQRGSEGERERHIEREWERQRESDGEEKMINVMTALSCAPITFHVQGRYY